MKTIPFTVDSALLKELGERLVGKPYIALAELVKNAYDADATLVTIHFDVKNDRIEISDNGHGMEFDEFRDYWMRIGTPHKQEKKNSRKFKRPLTGSKGVGRLAVQLLAKKIELSTKSKKKVELTARVEWKKAVRVGDLTKATAEYEFNDNKNKTKVGTKIVLKGLNHKWEKKDIQNLAREIWWLQPPFRSPKLHHEDTKDTFFIKFVSQEDYLKAFYYQLQAILYLAHARLIGKNESGTIKLSLEFFGDEPLSHEFRIEPCELAEADWEIRFFPELRQRQKHGIKVRDARDYLKAFGGVHVFDAGFRLPYYGVPQNDWLKTEFDHSHRLSLSKLLPPDLQEREGMTFLPTLSRIIGVVNVNTSTEDKLDISITRDRLVDSNAYNQLVEAVRFGIDWYAVEEKRRRLKKDDNESEIEPLDKTLEKTEMTLEQVKDEMPRDVYEKVHSVVERTVNAVKTEKERMSEKAALLGSLSTAGITALAYRHELQKQFGIIDSIIQRLEINNVNEREQSQFIERIKEDLLTWIERARATNSLFDYLGDPQNIELKERFLVKDTIEQIVIQVSSLGRNTEIDTSRISGDLLLPKASFAEWGSLFQNVLINAFNATIDSEIRMIEISTRKNGAEREILVQDTGTGVDLKNSDSLFEPFQRRMKISAERKRLGYGGTGLGLTIVNVLADNIGCTVEFTEPEEGFSTAFSLSWREMQ